MDRRRRRCFRAALPVAVTALEKMFIPERHHSVVVHMLLVPLTAGPILVTLGLNQVMHDSAHVSTAGLLCQICAVMSAAAKAVTTCVRPNVDPHNLFSSGISSEHVRPSGSQFTAVMMHTRAGTNSLRIASGRWTK